MQDGFLPDQPDYSLSFARRLDDEDPLRDFRARFHLPLTETGEEAVYFCGNSLGLQPRSVRRHVEQELRDWETLGVEGHFHAKHPWMPYHEFLTPSLARVMGAKPEEVVAMGSLTANLHFLMVSFFRPDEKRNKVMIEADAFPSDHYAVESQIRFHGYQPEDSLIEIRSSSGRPFIPTEEILERIEKEGDTMAMILLGGVNYYSGQAFEMEKITRAAHQKGIMVGFDLAHAAGNILLKLHDWGVDFAAWCSYKYLNSGPGGVAGIFVHEKHAKNPNIPRFAGWWGHDKQTRFLMGPEFHPMLTAEGWQLSNAPVLSMAAHKASLELFDEAGMENLVMKSKKLTAYLESLLAPVLGRLCITQITPPEPQHRGAQLSLLTGKDGRKIFDHLTASGIICDWREPDVIRIAPVPMYNSFEDCRRFSLALMSYAG